MAIRSVFINTIFFILASVLFFIITYLFGWELLQGSFKGNEMTFVLSMADWADRNLFQSVQWYPYHAAGGSVMQATQIAIYYVIAFLHRLSGLSLGQATRLTSFSIIFLTALEIYFLVYWYFKKRLMAILAGVFFLLSQAAWVETSYLGVLAHPFSVLFILPTIFLFNLYLRGNQTRILILTIILFGLSFLSHVLVAEMITGILFIWTLVFPFSLSVKDKWPVIKFGLLAFGKVVVLGSLLISFWLLPFFRYVGIVGRNLVAFRSPEQVGYITLPFLLGFGDAWGGSSASGVFFALPVLVFSLLGLIMAMVRRQRLVILLSLLAVGFLIYSGLPLIAPIFVKIFFINITEQSYERAFAIPLVFLPIIAAYGIVTVSELILWQTKGTIKSILSSILVIFLFFAGLFVFKHVPPAPTPPTPPCYFGLGPWFDATIDYCHFFDKLKNISFHIAQADPPREATIRKIASLIPMEETNRIDISPLRGILVMTMPLYTQASTINIQLNTANLNKIFWGYQVGAFYLRHEFGHPDEVASLASWFGIENLVLAPADPLEKYPQKYWQEVANDGDTILLHFKGQTGMLTLSSKPKILVLGKFINRAYEQFFRLANGGAFPYGRAMLVEGKDSGMIDDYTLDELKKFEIVLLYGYTYKDQKKAFELLEKYVNEGGRLFIETGWQYVSPNWQMDKTPAILPVKKLIWEQYKSWDLEGFSPPEYKGDAWGVSVGEELRNWGQPILSANGKIIAASGNYGQGKIVWSGMNLIGHAFIYNNTNEYQFIEKQLTWLLEGYTGEDFKQAATIKRLNPDQVEFGFNQPLSHSWLYWRENWYPDWRATLQGTTNREARTKLPIYRAGPNFMLIPLDKVNNGDKITLTLTKSKTFIAARLISLLMLILLIMVFIKPNLLSGLRAKLTLRYRPKTFNNLGKWWNKDEE